MSVYLLLAAVVMLCCVLFQKISFKFGIPTLLVFILLGMVFGSDGLVKIPFDDYGFAEQICSIALIFIMFYGGFGTKWSEARPVAVKAVCLSSLGVVFTTAFVGLFCYFVLKIDLLESLLLGAVISSTDAASVFSILRSRRLNLKYNTASLLEVESGSNDPFSYMLTAILLSVMQGSASAGQIAYMIFAQIVYGLAFGVVIALAASLFLKKFKFSAAGFDAIFIVAVALVAYAAPSALSGNGYLSAYIVGIVLGNQNIKNKRSLVHFFDGVTGMMQMLLFFLLGLLSFPSQLPQILPVALLIALFLTFIARPLTVFLLLTPFKSPIRQQLLVSWAGLRGAASIVFAVMATISPASTNNDIFHIVFCIVLFSILVQGSLIPLVAQKLNMTDKNADVMQTFTDYSDEVPVQFIELSMPARHPWAGTALKDIILPPDTILVLLLRDGQKIVPRGKTVLQAGDTLILSARAVGAIEGLTLTERVIDQNSKYLGLEIAQINKTFEMLIILIKRGNRVIIPRGKTVLKENDILVIQRSENETKD